MNEIVVNPFGARQQESSGSRQLQARENSETLALIAMAKRFPRNERVACDRIKNAFARVTLAESATYEYARGGTQITGASIRAAEAIAQQWGNLATGWREVSREVDHEGVGVSEIEAFCADYETTNRVAMQFFVRHWRDTKKGGYALKDERDIYELCANQAARRKRACILAQIPGDVVEMALDQAAVTLKSSADTTPEGQAKLVASFKPFGVTKEMIETRIQRRLDAITPGQVVLLRRIYSSLRDDMSNPGDWFAVADDAPNATGLDAVRAAANGAPPAPAEPARRGPGRPRKPPPGPEASAPAPTPPAASEKGQVPKPEPSPEPPPPPAAATSAPTAPDFALTADDDGPTARNYDDLAWDIMHAPDYEAAALVLDQARSMLDAADLQDLDEVFDRQWRNPA